MGFLLFLHPGSLINRGGQQRETVAAEEEEEDWAVECMLLLLVDGFYCVYLLSLYSQSSKGNSGMRDDERFC